MVYNLTAIGTNTTGIFTLVQTTNDVLLFGWGGILLLIGVCVVLFMSFLYSTQDANKSLLGTMFIGLTIAMLFKALNLIPSLVLWILLLATAALVAFSYKNR